MTIAAQAAKLLNGLGTNADEIAETLRGAGYKGSVQDGLECPCGACLRDHLGHPVHVSVWEVLDSDYKTSAPLSPAVATFVALFDTGAYPDLVA